MKTLLASSALLLASVCGAFAGSVTLAHDAVADREKSGTFRFADNFLTLLGEKGWDTESFPLNSIGGEDERLDQVRAGILDVSMSNFAVAVQMAPEMRVLQLPYAFENPAHEQAFFRDSDYLDQINEVLHGQGMHILAVVPNGGFLGIFNDKKEVRTVADMEGVRMRALDPSQLEMFRMMGADGVVIPWAEVPNAIQTGIADGYVNPSVVPLNFGQADLFSHYTDAKVIMSARLALASADWWEGLSEAEQAEAKEAAQAALDDVFAWVETSEEAHKKGLVEAGIAVYEPDAAELATFKAAVTGMRAQVPNVDAARVEDILGQIGEYAPK